MKIYFKSLFTGIVFTAKVLSCALVKGQIYKDSSMPIEKRVEDLLARMTIEEKLKQMTMHSFEGLKNDKIPYGVIESPFIHAKDVAHQSFIAKKYAREQTRLGIPPIQIAECLHGVLAFGATIFPQAINQGSTWNPELIEQMSAVIACEAYSIGVDQALSPLFDLARDPRFGRYEECFSEDPFLVSKMGEAFVVGMQGKPEQTVYKLPEGKIMCTAKHMAGYSVASAGINLAASSLGEREMRTLHLGPFEYAVKKANVYAIMPSYNEVDGIPAHRNKWMLDKVLRKEWNFQGYVFSDYGGLSMLVDFHKVANSRRAAALLGINAGVDLEAPRPDIYYHLLGLYKDGLVTEAKIDTAVKRILRVKFKAGVFDKKLPDTASVHQILRNPNHVKLAKKVADESIVLLKNENNLLPLDKKKINAIAVIGPNANQVQYGDYSYTRDNASGVTILEGIKKLGVTTHYAKGCDITGSDTSGFNEAIEAAKRSDIAVVVLGETSAVLSGLGWGVGLGENEPKDPFTGGEGYDVNDLNPMGVQRQLLKAIHATGKPIILVLVQGRPWSIDWEEKHIPTILEAWYPGEQGGNAVADIIFGNVNPSGKLSVTFPRSVGHIPVTYDYKPGSRGYYNQSGTPDNPGRDYVFSSPEPLFHFGHGLSYTQFEYNNLRVSKTDFDANDTVYVSIDIKNIGDRTGKEVVQLYVKDVISSVTTPFMALKAFEKIELKPGEKQTVLFKLSPESFSLWNDDMRRVVEPGEFIVMIGAASNDIRKQISIYCR